MSGNSFAAQAVANGPMTAANPSFDGHGWLVVLNLSLMTATAFLAFGVVLSIAADTFWRDRNRGPLVTLLRLIFIFAFGGMFLRTGIEAVTLWGWDPLDPAQTGWYLTMKRLVDPFGATGYFASICIYMMTRDALDASLEQQPWPKRLVGSLPSLARPAVLAVMSIVAAIGVVSTR